MFAVEAFTTKISQISDEELGSQMRVHKDRAYEIVCHMQNLPDIGSRNYQRLDSSFDNVSKRIRIVGAEIRARADMPVYSLIGGMK